MNENKGLLDVLRNCKEIKHEVFKKGEVIFKEDELPKGIYCIDKGSIKLFKKSQTGEERIIYLATSGEILGLHSVVNNHPYASTAAVISDTNTSFLSIDDFMNLIKSNNTYKLLVMKSLCSRIDSIEEHIVEVTEKISEERLADTLLMLADKYGVDSSMALNISLTLEELASLTCTSKSYMKKIVSDFSTRGLVSISADTIKILNLPKLKTITNHI